MHPLLMAANGVVLARAYLRVSQDESGRLRSPEEQLEALEEAGGRFGLTFGDSYAEVEAISASKYARKARPDFDSLMKDLRSGQFGAPVLALYMANRASRQTEEWLALLDACVDAGVWIFIGVNEKFYDPSNGQDRKALLDAATAGEAESWEKSVSIQRAVDKDARNGRPGGGTAPHGYIRLHDERTGKFLGLVKDPEYAPLVEELVDRLFEGEAITDIQRDFEARGVRSRNGKVVPISTLRAWALRPAIAGLRSHNPDDRSGLSLVNVTKGDWEPIITDLDKYYAVRDRLTRASRLEQRPGLGGVAQYTGVGTCAECRGPLRSGAGYYRCRDNGCVGLPIGATDAFLTRVLQAYLSVKGNYAKLVGRSSTDPQLLKVRADLVEAHAEMAKLVEEAKARAREGKKASMTLSAQEDGWAAQIEALEARERELSTPSALKGLLGAGRFTSADDVRQRWDAMTDSARRQAARLLFTAELIGVPRARRKSSRGARVDIEDRITFDKTTPADGAANGPADGKRDGQTGSKVA